MSAAGVYIWQGVKPCLKMLLTIICGFALAKKGLFPPLASKGFSQIVMNVGLPCLLFSSMVSSFNDTNISNFGPLALIAVVYQILGFSIMVVIRELVYVPPDFQWGVLMLGLNSNWASLPTAIVQSVANEAPFNAASDPQLGIAYIAVPILMMNIVFYGSGIYKVCGWDLREGRRDVPRTLAGRIGRRIDKWRRLHRCISRKCRNSVVDADPITSVDAALPIKGQDAALPVKGQERIDVPLYAHAEVPRDQDSVINIALAEERIPRGGPYLQPHIPVHSKTNLSADEENQYARMHTFAQSTVTQTRSDTSLSPNSTLMRAIYSAVKSLLTPITLGVILSLPFALASPLKALLVNVPGWTDVKIPNAPDGKPPLSFFYDFTSFVGGLTLPGTLILLGASFARLSMNRERIKQMPVSAIIAVTIGKLFLMPIFGILIVTRFRISTSLFPTDQKMLSFVAFLLSGTPSAVNQLATTAIFAKDGQPLDTLAAFFLAQYSLLIFQTSALTAISLWLINK